MNGRFILGADMERETLDWGSIGWVSRPSLTRAQHLTVMDVSLEPENGHAFHKHPEQEEVIWVREGRVEQWLERESQELGAGDAVFIPKDVVHASFNVGDSTAKLSVMLGPCAGEGGYESVEVAGDEPWASLRPGSA